MYKLMSFYWIINIAAHAVAIKQTLSRWPAYAGCIFSFIDSPLVGKIERRHIIVACASLRDTNMIGINYERQSDRGTTLMLM